MKSKSKHIIIIILLIIIKSSFAQGQTHISNDDTLLHISSIIQNAVYDKITCQINGAEFLEYYIYDRSGKQVKQGWFLGSIPVKYLTPGIYSLVINFKDKKIKKEFLKLKSDPTVNEDELIQ